MSTIKPAPRTSPDLNCLDVDRYRERLLSLYADLDETVASLSPVCLLSGRCCRFNEYGHALFLSAPEAALLFADAPAPSRPLDDGATCPWQDEAGRCSARDCRPIGCRVYFCDPSYEPHAPDVSEEFIARLKSVVNELGLPWEYAPLHHHLRIANDEGRFVSPARPSARPAAS